MRLVLVGLAAVLLGGLLASMLSRPAVADEDRSCKEQTVSTNGVVYRVQFAKNGAVQQFLLVQSSHNPETDHDVRTKLEKQFGPEAVNAPPLQITSFRKGSGAMMIPDKAVDSCGRVTHFH